MFYVVLLCSLQMHLDELADIQLHADSLAHDLTCKNQVLQGSIVRGCRNVASGMLSLSFCMAPLRWLRWNSPLSNKDNVLPTECFLQFMYKLDLDFLERLQLRNRNKDYNSFPTNTNFNLLGCCYIELL